MVRIRPALPAALCFAGAFTCTFTRAISQRIYSDEQLFLGGAGLMARGEGLVYRDFFYNHMPTHALVLAALCRLTSWWTFAARTLDAACGALIATLIFESARRVASSAPRGWRNAVAVSVVAIFLFNPVTSDAVGKVWNHDFAAVACLGGLLALCAGLSRPTPARWTLAAGVLAAIAATSRLTFAPLLVVFPLLILLAPGGSFVVGRAIGARVRLLASWSIGLVIGAAPALWICLQSPAVAYFGNVRFNAYSARYHAEDTSKRQLLLSKKFEFVGDALAASPSLSIIFALTLIAFVIAFWQPRCVPSSLARVRLVCLTLIVAIASVAAFAPTPMYNQYLYGPMPFAILAIAWSAALIDLASRRWLRVAFLVVAATCVGFGATEYRGVWRLATPSSWTPVQAHADAVRLAELVGPGRVLTFAPGLTMEAGLPIYPELAIGRYGIRIGHMLKPKQRTTLHLPDMPTVATWFDRDPPAAVLLVTPWTPQEKELAALAVAHGYRVRPFSTDGRLYLPPTR